MQQIEFDEIIKRAETVDDTCIDSAKDMFRKASANLDPSQDTALDKSGRLYHV